MRIGLDSDEVVWSALSDMYGKCGSIEEARRIFDKMVDRDVVSWTAMIGRYFEEGRREEGLALFSELMRSGIRPNEFTFAGVLNACADHAAEDLGKQVHGYMTRIGFDPFSFAASALVHMYLKCGNIENAKRVFKGVPRPDLVSWTSLIVGYAQNGQPNEALKFFELLLKSGTQPDHIIFVGVLSACTHAGFVDKGIEYSGQHLCYFRDVE
jgi:pentatricopeptide repeat protein